MPDETLLTLREIRQKYFPNVPMHRIQYCLNEVHPIAPRRRAGMTRLYGSDQVDEFKAAMAKVATHGGWKGTSPNSVTAGCAK